MPRAALGDGPVSKSEPNHTCVLVYLTLYSSQPCNKTNQFVRVQRSAGSMVSEYVSKSITHLIQRYSIQTHVNIDLSPSRLVTLHPQKAHSDSHTSLVIPVPPVYLMHLYGSCTCTTYSRSGPRMSLGPVTLTTTITVYLYITRIISVNSFIRLEVDV